MSDITNIANSVMTILNEADLGQPFTAVRSYTPAYDKVKQTGIYLFVIPTNQQFENSTRGDTLRTCTVMIGIYNAISFDEYGSHSAIEIDAMLSFAEKVCDLFLSNDKVENPDAFVTDVSNPLTFDPRILDQENLFATVVEVNFQRIR